MKAAVFWIRWLLVVPAFLAGWFVVPPIIGWVLTLLGVKLPTSPEFSLVSGAGILSFFPPLFCTAIAPGGRLLVGAVAAFMNALPGLFIFATDYWTWKDIQWAGAADHSEALRWQTVQLTGTAFLAGAGLAFLLIYIVARPRRPLENPSTA